MPSVSVVVPTYYRNDSLDNALDSIANQSHSSLETIVVDDSGEEYARDIVSNYSVNYIPLPENKGANPARTLGVQHSNGEYIQFLDDDDQLHPRKIERQIQRFSYISDKVGVVYCGLTDGRGRSFHPQPDLQGDILEQALSFETWPCVNSTMLISRPILEEILPLIKRPAADDNGMLIELAQRTEFDYINEILVTKDMEGKSRGRSMTAVHERSNIIREYKDLYDRVDRSVYKRARRNLDEKRARAYLAEQIWSFDAIVSFSRVVWSDPTPRSIGYFLSSFFGRPGIGIWSRVFHKLMNGT